MPSTCDPGGRALLVTLGRSAAVFYRFFIFLKMDELFGYRFRGWFSDAPYPTHLFSL